MYYRSISRHNVLRTYLEAFENKYYNYPGSNVSPAVAEPNSDRANILTSVIKRQRVDRELLDVV